MHRLKILETFPIFLCKIRGWGDTIWEYDTKGLKGHIMGFIHRLNVRTTLHVPKTADCGTVIISLVRQLCINSDQSKRDTSGENRAVVPKRGKVTQYLGLIARWWLLQNLREFQSPSEAKQTYSFKNSFKMSSFPSFPLFAFFVSRFASYGFFAFLHFAGDRISVSSTASSSSFPEVQSPKILPEGKHSNNMIIIIADSSNATKHITTTTTTTTSAEHTITDLAL